MAVEKQELICDEISDEIISIAERMAVREGAHNVNVKKIITEMGVTNRVFYNRFHNSDEVLWIVYENAMKKMRSSFNADAALSSRENIYDFCMKAGVKVLNETYDIKMKFSRYMFEHDSLSQENKNWWLAEIRKIVNYAKENDLIDNVDTDMLCYTVWGLCRGYTVDAISKKLSKEDAVKYFEFGFGYFLKGLLKKD